MAKLGKRPHQAPARQDKPLDQPTKMPPHPVEGREWTQTALRYWSTIWQADARYYWLPEDLPLIERCLFMADLQARDMLNAAYAAEWRRTEEAIYLSPGSRQRARIGGQQRVGQPVSAAPTASDDLAAKRLARQERMVEG